MELAIYTKEGQDTGRKAQLNDAVFDIEVNEHAIYLDVKQYLANQRQGTHKSKERSEVSGSTRKLHKQKGGGGSRIGDINSPLLSGGGRVFGPRPRDYRFKLNKKLKSLARKSALTVKAHDGQIKVVEDLNLQLPKTKEYVKIAKALGVDGKKALLVVENPSADLMLASRNVPNTAIYTPADLNTYILMNKNAVVITEGSLNYLNNL